MKYSHDIHRSQLLHARPLSSSAPRPWWCWGRSCRSSTRRSSPSPWPPWVGTSASPSPRSSGWPRATSWRLALVTPVSGWAVDRFGAKRIWMTSIALFVIGSSLCGLAWSADSLIFFRVLQGIGGGMLLPVGQSILARAAGPQRMGRVMSIIGVPMVMGPVLGPVLGGLIVSNYSWRWIFYINVPIGIISLILSSQVAAQVRRRRAADDPVRHARVLPALPGPRRAPVCAVRGRHDRELHQHVGPGQLRAGPRH